MLFLDASAVLRKCAVLHKSQLNWCMVHAPIMHAYWCVLDANAQCTTSHERHTWYGTVLTVHGDSWTFDYGYFPYCTANLLHSVVYTYNKVSAYACWQKGWCVKPSYGLPIAFQAPSFFGSSTGYLSSLQYHPNASAVHKGYCWVANMR